MATAAERQRKKRLLEKLDLIEAKLLVSPQARDVLIESGHLAQWDENDPQAVRAALQRMIDSLAIGTVTP